MNRPIKVFALLLATINIANAQILECKISDPSQFAWIAAISINEKSGNITLTETEDQGKKTYTTKLVDFSDGRYTFNLPPQEKSGVTNMFLLSKPFNEWGLLSVGVEQKNGATVLRAMDKYVIYDCFKKSYQ